MKRRFLLVFKEHGVMLYLSKELYSARALINIMAVEHKNLLIECFERFLKDNSGHIP